MELSVDEVKLMDMTSEGVVGRGAGRNGDVGRMGMVGEANENEQETRQQTSSNSDDD